MAGAAARAAQNLSLVVQEIGQQAQGCSVLHADETGLRVGSRLHWMHVVATPELTWLGRHEKRGQQATESFGVLTSFTGTLVRDGWKAYNYLPCQVALCNAHHIRELTQLHEQGHEWAGRMKDHLLASHSEVSAADGVLDVERRLEILRGYNRILEEGEALNPEKEPEPGKKGRVRQSDATNLLIRLRTQVSAVWRFMNDPRVPFSNNVAEQAIRMQKVKQKVSGCFRSPQGADDFCTIRSYTGTMRKQGHNVLSCLVNAFMGNVTAPRFSN